MNKNNFKLFETALNAISKMSGFQKLLLFFAPEFLLIFIQKFLFELVWHPPVGIRGGVLLLFIWLVLIIWSFLLISFQVHWEKHTKIKAIKISTIVISILLIAFCAFYIFFG